MSQQHTTVRADNRYKGTRRRLRIILVLLTCFMGWAGLTLWGQSEQVHSKNSTLEQMDATLEQVKQQNEAYKQELLRLEDPEYIEQLIRKDLNMTKPDETIFIQTK